MTTLVGRLPISEAELKALCTKHAKHLTEKEKIEHSVYIHILDVLKDVPTEKRNEDMKKDFDFVRECLLQEGVGKISELKEFRGEKAPPSIPFEMLSTKKVDDPRDTCRECDTWGNLGCPEHRELIRQLFG